MASKKKQSRVKKPSYNSLAQDYASLTKELVKTEETLNKLQFETAEKNQKIASLCITIDKQSSTIADLKACEQRVFALSEELRRYEETIDLKQRLINSLSERVENLIAERDRLMKLSIQPWETLGTLVLAMGKG